MSSIESNLENSVFSFRGLEDFIAQDFSPVSYSKSELRQANHPIELYRFNRIYKNDLPLSLFGIAVKNIYAYRQNDDNLCLYLLLPVNSHRNIDRFCESLGRPWNVTEDDYRQRRYGSLMWQKEELEVVLMKNFDYSNPESTNLLIITNIKLSALVNNDPW
ncbi:hypothetical protein AAFN85_16315 [Mucilaginibacter sp. CAU 1740]|uniref:hypothetical protein n=1 Tax=Mucilaginibacter sp. CAU 1740 TaxID=3140365 RepID=UPI00325C278B